jgi:hypothetical protein
MGRLKSKNRWRGASLATLLQDQRSKSYGGTPCRRQFSLGLAISDITTDAGNDLLQATRRDDVDLSHAGEQRNRGKGRCEG